MNFKNLSFLLAFACVVPAFADETAETQVTQEEKHNYALEDACNSKMALATIGMVAGAVGGVAAGVTTGSVLAGGALCALPVGVYAYLSHKYKNMFDEEAYKRICDTEDKTFYLFMITMTSAAILTLGSGMGLGAGEIIGSAAKAIASYIGINPGIAKAGALVTAALIPTAIEANSEPTKDNATAYHHDPILSSTMRYTKYLAYMLMGAGIVA